MSLSALFSGLSASIGLTDSVSKLFDGFDFLSTSAGSFTKDLLGGAITNGAIAAISGGDIGKAALYGAVGGAFSDGKLTVGGQDIGQFGNEFGAGIAGYGLDVATGGSGLLGAGVGALGAFGRDNDVFASKGGTEAKSLNDIEGRTQGSEFGAINPAAAGTNQTSSTGGLLSMLQNESGEGTLLGKTLVGGIAGMASQKNAEDLAEQKLKDEKEYYRDRSNVDAEAEQARIAAFANPNFRIQRNG